MSELWKPVVIEPSTIDLFGVCTAVESTLSGISSQLRRGRGWTDGLVPIGYAEEIADLVNGTDPSAANSLRNRSIRIYRERRREAYERVILLDVS